jgi:hypothetical protein
MNRYFFVGAALLLSATTAGIAIAAAAGESGFSTTARHARITVSETAGRGDRPILLASESREHDRRADRLAKRDRRHHDDDGDEDEDGGRGAVPQNGPANPNTPVPDNGLFNGNSRPKVQVQ